MKTLLVAIAVFATICAGALGALGAGRALATTTTQHATTKTVKIVMHDPGCHWFFVHGKYKTKDTVKANRVRIVNQDEATLKVARPAGWKYIPVGKSIVLPHGAYWIEMVGQAPDDNHLQLIVS